MFQTERPNKPDVARNKTLKSPAHLKTYPTPNHLDNGVSAFLSNFMPE